MREIKYTTRFQRDYKREKSGRHSRKLDTLLMDIVNLLAIDAALPRQNFDHVLSGQWSDHRDCHIKPDLILIYRKPDDASLERLPGAPGLTCRTCTCDRGQVAHRLPNRRVGNRTLANQFESIFGGTRFLRIRIAAHRPQVFDCFGRRDVGKDPGREFAVMRIFRYLPI